MLSECEFDNLEMNIVGLFFAMGCEFYQINKEILTNVSRIEKSIEVLYSIDSYKNEQELIKLRKYRNTRFIVLRWLEYKYNNGNISGKKYEILKDFFEQKIILLNGEQKKILFEQSI